MNLVLGVTEGLREIWAHKFRSFLTMFGIAMGVGSLMATFALAAGMAAGQRESLQMLGGVERVEVRDAQPPPEQESLAYLSKGRTYRDALAIRKSAPLVETVSPEIEFPGAKVTYGENIVNPRFVGAMEGIMTVDRHEVAYGRFITDLDVARAHRICILGRGVVDELFDEPEAVPLGKMIHINGQPFQVVGILTRYVTESQKRADRLGLTSQMEERRKERGANSKNRPDQFWFKNRLVIIPITTMQVVFKSAQVDANSGLDLGPDMKLTRLAFQVSDLHQFDETMQEVRNVLNLTHHGIRDFAFDTREDWFDAIERRVQSFRLSFGFIAAICLFVGGLGVTNIMLASITERIRELGIRRAIGARGRDIFGQIIIEGTVLSLMGGGLGLLTGYGVIQLLISLSPSENNPIIEPSSLLISLSSSVFIGLVAGLYPAWKASKLSPIQALRYE